GDFSKLGEFIYDYPYQWGSKRTGPDLHRVGGKYPDVWHYHHMKDPRSTSPGSNMPNYPWLHENEVDLKTIETKLRVMRTLGVPYDEGTIANAEKIAREQAIEIAANLAVSGVKVEADREIIAVIAYLQKLGKSEVTDGAE